MVEHLVCVLVARVPSAPWINRNHAAINSGDKEGPWRKKKTKKLIKIASEANLIVFRHKSIGGYLPSPG